jgi:2-iminobutanoate/2-iminopropanoate deaminase
MSRQTVATPGAPAAVGPYSQGIVAGGFVFCSGQIPLDPATGELIEGSIADQTRRCMHNLAAVLEAAGSSLEKVVKFTVFMIDIDDYAEVNSAFPEFVGNEPPARAAIAVAGLPKGAAIEIECVAVL